MTSRPVVSELVTRSGSVARWWGRALWGRVIGGLGPRAVELLVFLAAHPGGVGHDTVVSTLWPEADRRRPTNALNSTLARLRAVLRKVDPAAAWLVTSPDGRYRLDPDLVRVDDWDFLVAATHVTDLDPGSGRAPARR